ncbi:MAG: dethiobiotin synthase [Hahellaceae bacterium]|nr:dethiobiotin synthase [Hahellaceae bacterium]
MARCQFFITGTDTEVGKTFVTSAMLAKLSGEGLRTLGLKPVAAGAESRAGETNNEGRYNEDALSLMAYASVKIPYAQVNPVLLSEPIAPHIAARSEGRSLSVSRLVGFCRGTLMTPHDVAFVEGAGGWLVPLNATETLADLAQALAMPVILVVGMRLGCINHALLTVASIQRQGLRLAGWIANASGPAPMREYDANLETLVARIPAPLLGNLPWGAGPEDPQVRTALTLSPLFS